MAFGGGLFAKPSADIMAGRIHQAVATSSGVAVMNKNRFRQGGPTIGYVYGGLARDGEFY